MCFGEHQNHLFIGVNEGKDGLKNHKVSLTFKTKIATCFIFMNQNNCINHVIKTEA